MRKRFGRWLTPLLVALLFGLGLVSPGMFWHPGPQAWMWRPSPTSWFYRPAPQAEAPFGMFWRP